MRYRSILWPSDIRNTQGIFYGWQQDDDVVIAGVLEVQTPKEAEALLNQLVTSSASDELVKELLELSGGRPSVLGTCHQDEKSALPVFEFLEDVKEQLEGQRLVLYKRPQLAMLRFFTLEPLPLDITSGHTKQVGTLSQRMAALHELDYAKLVNNAKPMTQTINQLNVAYELHRILTKSPGSSSWPRFNLPTSNFIAKPLQFLISATTGICNFKIFGTNTAKDVSATLQQIDTRMEQATILPSQFHLIQQRSRLNVAYSTAQYISFYKCIWLILNDMIVGTTVGIVLCENADVLGHLLAVQSKTYTVDLIKDTLMWLDNWPVGLKLNTQLSQFLCLLFLSLTNSWSGLLDFLRPVFPQLIYVLGLSGHLGSTMILSIAADALSLLTVHLYIGYLIATAIFSQLLSVAGSLWRLFRGKRWNVLRNRTDSWDYDLDQLLLGTILFTLLAFLFPTVLVYYALFALARIGVIMIHATLETCLAFMNHFPLFAMMLRVKDPSRLPGGIYFDLSSAGKGFIELKNQPISFGRIFFQHVRAWSKLSAHYAPLRLLRCLVTGTFITPIQRYHIRYNVIRRSYDPPKRKME